MFGWSGIAATFCPTMILSLLWDKFNEKGAIASMITGFLSVPIFKFGLGSLEEYGIYFQRLGELGPSFIMAIIVGITVSLMFTDKTKEHQEIK